MKRRFVPGTISKRFRRKLARKKPEDRFLFWLRCKRPAVYARLTRLWSWQLIERIIWLDPYATPLISALPRITAEDVRELWRLDAAETYARGVDPAC